METVILYAFSLVLLKMSNAECSVRYRSLDIVSSEHGTRHANSLPRSSSGSAGTLRCWTDFLSDHRAQGRIQIRSKTAAAAPWKTDPAECRGNGKDPAPVFTGAEAEPSEPPRFSVPSLNIPSPDRKMVLHSDEESVPGRDKVPHSEFRWSRGRRFWQKNAGCAKKIIAIV